MEIFNSTTSKMVTDSHNADNDKRQQKTFQRLVDPTETSSKIVAGKFKRNF